MTAVEVTRLFERDPSTVRARPRGPLLRSSGTFVSPTVEPEPPAPSLPTRTRQGG
jgi:hypothetical protein